VHEISPVAGKEYDRISIMSAQGWKRLLEEVFRFYVFKGF